MLQIAVIRERKEEVIKKLLIKNFDASDLLERVLAIDAEKRKNQQELEALLAEQNTLAKQVGDLYKSGKKAEGDELKNRSTALKELSKKLEESQGAFEKEMTDILVRIPNIPAEGVPSGKLPEDNEVVFESQQPIPVLDRKSVV